MRRLTGMKRAYLIVTDLHIIDKILVSNRIDYSKEMKVVNDALFDFIENYKSRGYEVILLFLGDIYHRGYTDPSASIDGNNLLIYLSQQVSGMYTVVGNHELTYYRNNPFYTLFSQANSTRLERVNDRVTRPKGRMQIINIVDILEDGEVLFNFNHYGCGIGLTQEGKVNIGLFHQEVVCSEILSWMKKRFDMDIFVNDVINLDKDNVFRGYDYCFLGHMHKMYGKFEMEAENTGDETTLYYLGSLGRTNHSEIQDNFLERNIPAVLVENGCFSQVEDNKFNLLPRSKCIREEIVKENQEKRKEVKEFKKLKDYKASSDNPVQNVYEQVSTNPEVTKILLDLQNSNIDQIGESLQEKIEKLKRNRILL